MSDMEFGCITYWNPERGSGFLNPDDGFGYSRFVHFSQIRRTGLSILPRGQRVSYSLGPDRNGKMMAVNVELLGREQTDETQADAPAEVTRIAAGSVRAE